MSILIKGMDMPKTCGKCMLKNAIECNRWKLVRSVVLDRHKDCPLIPVPPHGRLIDADKQDAQIEALIERHLHGYTKSTWDFVCELRDILKRDATVIPKESAEEEKNDK